MTINSSENTRFISISENVKIIKNEMSEAAIKSGRKPEDVKLMAVTKTVAPIFINWAIEECGIDLIGENKVQEFLSKKEELKLSGVDKHLIGHLQTNKVRKIINEVDMIQSVDSVRLAKAISDAASKDSSNIDILLEINIGDEESKTGFDKEVFNESLMEISELPFLNVKGLMTIPPICDDNLLLEKYFDSMNEYFNEIKNKKLFGDDFNILSMGMSGDYKEAILHGSNLVRVGSLIFGARIYK